MHMQQSAVVVRQSFRFGRKEICVEQEFLKNAFELISFAYTQASRRIQTKLLDSPSLRFVLSAHDDVEWIIRCVWKGELN